MLYASDVPAARHGLSVNFSSDGVHWGDQKLGGKQERGARRFASHVDVGSGYREVCLVLAPVGLGGTESGEPRCAAASDFADGFGGLYPLDRRADCTRPLGERPAVLRDAHLSPCGPLLGLFDDFQCRDGSGALRACVESGYAGMAHH